MQQKIAEVRKTAAKNTQTLTQYTWVEKDTISLKSEQKK